MKRPALLICLFLGIAPLHAQTPCDSIDAQFLQWNQRLDKLNTHDPELIPLHYLFLQDIRQEMARFERSTLQHLTRCLQTDYYLTLSAYHKIRYHANTLESILFYGKEHVDYLLYQKAEAEMNYADTSAALYYLDRALQYNKHQPDALLMKARIALAQHQYQESVDFIHLLYTQSELDEPHEQAVSDFTTELYERLYNRGNELAQSGHSADALEIFLALEQFCSNMPTGYCNDDYYKGILRSRQGVYDSYIAIAKEAEKRHNHEMARKFYQYAEEYQRNNP